jgi:hypothetical protein
MKLKLRLMALLVSRVQIETAIWSHHQPHEENRRAKSEPPWGETRLTDCDNLGKQQCNSFGKSAVLQKEPKTPLHFVDLKHEQRVPYIRTGSVLACKPLIHYGLPLVRATSTFPALT